MSVCSRCKKSTHECELTWVELPKKYHMQVRPSMEVVCDDCIKKETTSSLSSFSS
jgi:hypothetical protein